MSIINHVFNTLAGDVALKEILAINKIDGTPAIFEEWTPEFNDFPYINLRYEFNEGNHWGKREGTIYVDIFGNKDSTELERIKNRVIFLLDRKTINEGDPSRARIYSRTDSPIMEDTPNVKHWSIEFTCIFWRVDFVEHLNNQ